MRLKDLFVPWGKSNEEKDINELKASSGAIDGNDKQGVRFKKAVECPEACAQ